MDTDKEIIVLQNSEKKYLAYKRPARPKVGDLALGFNGISRVKKIYDMVDYENFELEDGSILINPQHIIEEIEG